MNVGPPLPAGNSSVGRVTTAVSSAGGSLLNTRRMSKDADQARHDEQMSVGKSVLLSTKVSEVIYVGWKKVLHKHLGPFEIL